MDTLDVIINMYVYGRRRLACLLGRELITPSTCIVGYYTDYLGYVMTPQTVGSGPCTANTV
jgi:hypothetical protein